MTEKLENRSMLARTLSAPLAALFLASTFMGVGLMNTKALAEQKGVGIKPEHQLKTSAQISSKAVEKEKKKAKEVANNLDQKAIKAVADTYKVLDLLKQKKSKQALELLKKVIGEMEIILAANKKAALIPINSYQVVVDVDLSPKEIRSRIDDVREKLNAGDIQGARQILDTLQSEIDVIIEQLPLGTYPDAMKLASKYIIDGKIDEAKSVLSIALNSMVLKTIVIPLPLVRAADLIKAASNTAKIDKTQALKYLDEAKKQLKVAELLGYGKKDSKTYNDLEKRIESIQKEIKGQNKAEKMFEELINKLKEFRKHIGGKK